MQPIQDLLNDIKWNPNKNPDDYVLGYYDRVSKKIIEIALVRIDSIEEGFMTTRDDRGYEIHIPLHRIRLVKEKGNIIWQRPEHETS